MASGSLPNYKIHGESIGTGRPNIYVNIEYSDVHSTNGSTATGRISCSLCSLESDLSFFGYYITVSAAIGNGSWTQLFHKNDTPIKWYTGEFNGAANITGTCSGGSADLKIKVESNCGCSGYSTGKVFTFANVSVYSTPSAPTISVNKNMVAAGDTVTVTFSGDTNYSGGTEMVQYSFNKSTASTVLQSGGQNAGTFDISIGPDGGKEYTIYCRKYLSDLGYSGYGPWSNGVTVKTYSTPTVTGIKISPSSTVNGNTATTVKWDTWTGAWGGESSVCSADIVDSSNRVIQSISSNIANGTNEVTFTPNVSNMLSKDNESVYIRISRKHNITNVVGTGRSTYVVRYTPTEKVINVNPSRIGDIYAPRTITWSYPSGYNGIVSGYNIVITDEVNNTVRVDTNVTYASYNIEVSKLYPTHSNSISITPYYQNGSNIYMYDDTVYTISNYMTFIASMNTPVISYPKISGKSYSYWISDKPSFKIVFDLPEDGNYGSLTPSEKNSYRYKDVVVAITCNGTEKLYSIKDYPSAYSLRIDNLKHKSTIIFDPVIADIDYSGPISMRVRVMNFFDVWSDYSEPKQLAKFNLEEFTTNQGDIILASTANIVAKHSRYISSVYYGTTPGIPNVSKGTIIDISYLRSMYDAVYMVYQTTMEVECDNNLKYDITGFENNSYVAGDFINTNSYLKFINDMIKKLCDI